MSYPTSRIIATKTWYPEMLEHIRKNWNMDFDWLDYIKFVKSLNKILDKIRKEGHAKPAMFFCKTCNKRHESNFSEVSVGIRLFETFFKFKLLGIRRPPCLVEKYP